MTDLKDFTDSAALAAGKSLVKQRLEELSMSDEEKQARSEERAASRKKTLIKWGAIGVGVLVVFASLVAALASIWPYVLGLAIVGGLGTGAYFYAKPKVIALKDKAKAKLTSGPAEAEPEPAKVVVDPAAAKKQRLEEELAALKRKA